MHGSGKSSTHCSKSIHCGSNNFLVQVPVQWHIRVVRATESNKGCILFDLRVFRQLRFLGHCDGSVRGENRVKTGTGDIWR